MKKERIKFLAIIAGAFLFNFVFWQEKMALNTILYDAFVLAILFVLYPEARRVSTVRWLTLGHLICLAMILVHNTMLSKIAFITTLGLLTGFAEYVHRSVWYAGGSAIMNGIFTTVSIAESAEAFKRERKGKKRKSKLLGYITIPLLLGLLFFIIYASANSVFSEFTEKISISISDFFSNISEWISFKRLMFLLAGFYLTAWILLRSKLNYFEKEESQCKDDLVRRRKPLIERKMDPFHNMGSGLMGRLANGMMALKNMNTIGLISLILLNVLLLAINIIDIRYVWFELEYRGDLDLYKIIHEGTDLLIISILLAMAVLIIFFRGNLNFYKANKWLKYMAYAWIIQNSILAVSVLLRGYHYININGLAYKRIGVLFYLALVLVGLVSVFWKIYAKKTTYFLFRVNAWALIVLLVGSTTVNWDEFIASYNFKRKDEILMPVDFMVTLSNKAIPLLDQNVQVLREQAEKHRQLGYPIESCHDCFINTLKTKQADFLYEQQDYTWLSYNLADESVKKYLEQKYKYTAK
jgi:Domain of unknown function (DUF4173)